MADRGERETAHLGVLSGVNVRYLEVVESSAALRVTGRAGRLTPGHATSLGKAMLAAFDDDTVRRRYSGVTLGTPTGQTLADVDALLGELSRTRVRGWARNREEMEVGVCSVGMTVVHPGRGLLGGISLATPQARSTAAREKEHAGLLRAAQARMLTALDG